MGLGKWFKEDWVDIGSPKKGGGFKKCGRSKAKGSKRKYPKTPPLNATGTSRACVQFELKKLASPISGLRITFSTMMYFY